LACLSALLGAPQALSEPSSIAAKEAEVQSVLGQINALDSSLQTAIEAYNSATAQLQQVREDLRVNTQHLVLAKANLRRSHRQLAERLVALYTSGEDESTFAVLLGATSLDDFLNRMDTVDRVSEQDSTILREVIQARAEVQRRQERLKRARARAEELVAERAAHKRSIESQLAERRQLVSSIRAEIERMKEEEARRQAELARQAQERARQAATAPAFTPSTSSSGDSSSGGTSSSSSSSSESTAPPVVSAPSRGGVVGIAMQYLGTPYVWAGASPSGFDCSGFVMYVFAQVGVSLPHSSYAQYGMGVPVSQSQLQPGDLVFFDGLGHVGIYVGGGQFIHSPHTGDVVKISAMTGWYASSYVGARRV
jgi:cell wall-associated NlpC family hydrolase